MIISALLIWKGRRREHTIPKTDYTKSDERIVYA